VFGCYSRIRHEPHGAAACLRRDSRRHTSTVLVQYRRIIDSSLGEGKHLYQDLLKVKAAASTLARLRTRADYRAWNTTYEMTIDDLSFLCAFLTWYLASRAHGELHLSEFEAIGLSTDSVLFVPSSQASRLRMRYFIDGGKPITDYRDYLALID
jgi:hypothetical protein